jgi:oligo-1,6-glucosidase/alpha-glucosidase
MHMAMPTQSSQRAMMIMTASLRRGSFAAAGIEHGSLETLNYWCVPTTTNVHSHVLLATSVPWWKRTTVYQIYPRSFADANGDGIGDLPGIIGKLDYLKELGVETVWLSPFFQSPQADFGYDISDHFAIAPEYGTMSDFRQLVSEVHARGMKIVLDMVLNHTSDRHPWFVESGGSRDNPRRDWYIWRSGRKPYGRAPPNNWRSMLGGSAWHHDRRTDQWYYASFLPHQPDLNYRNEETKAAMLGVVRHWLEEGADGLRLDIFNAIFKDESFADNPFSFRPVPSEDNPHGFFQRHVHTIDHPDTIAFARELRSVVDEFDDPPRFLVGEVFGDARLLRRYCGEAADGLHLVFLFKSLRTRLTGPAMRAMVGEFEQAFPDPFSPTYVLGNHDRPRFAHRVRSDRETAKLVATLQLTARGVPFIYYGEEIGMANHDIPLHEGLDPVASRYRFVPPRVVAWLRRRGVLLNRDECRTPMQWDDGPHAGFTTAEARPWLPVHPNYSSTNVAAQSKDPRSILNCYRQLLALRRQQEALQSGALDWLDEPRLPDAIVAFRRTPKGSGRAVDVFLNFSRREIELDLSAYSGRDLFSSRRGGRSEVPKQYRLTGHEGIVVFHRV